MIPILFMYTSSSLLNRNIMNVFSQVYILDYISQHNMLGYYATIPWEFIQTHLELHSIQYKQKMLPSENEILHLVSMLFYTCD